MAPFSIVHLFSHSSVTRGGAIQGLLLARAFQEHGHRVVAFFRAPSSSNAHVPPDAFQHVVTRDLDIRRIDMKHPLSYIRFRRWLRQKQIDIVHTHKGSALIFGYFSTLGLAHPILIANRGTTYPLKRRLVERLLHRQHVRHVIAVADAVKQALIQAHHLPADKISIVYGSFDEQRFHPGLQRANVHQLWHVPASAPLIVCIAVMDRRKGLQVLLRAACQVIQTFPTATFLVVGHIHNRVYFQELPHEVERLGLTERVIFTGHRTDVAEILAAADVSVNASTEGEGLTGALREALAMQKPVVCTAVCGNTEMVHDKESGWVVEPGNADALAAAIVEALSYPDEARRRAAKGYEWTLQHCTSNFRYHQTEHIYRALLQTPSSRF